MTWLIDPTTRELLPALESDAMRRYGPIGHAPNGWVFDREDGIPVRMRWVECHCPAHQVEIDALNAEFREPIRR